MAFRPVVGSVLLGVQDAAGWPNDIAVTQYLGPPEMEEVQGVLFEKWVKLVMR